MEYKTIYIDSWVYTPKDGAYHVILPHGQERWLVDYKEHREDGPAITYRNDEHSPYYYLNGQRYPKKKYYAELLNRGLITKEECFIICI